MKKLRETDARRYDWARATRGTLARRAAAERTNLRALDDELSEAFPDSASVNATLRAVLAILEAMAPKRRRKRPTHAA